MIEKELPTVDTVEGFERLERDIRRDTRRRRTVIGVAAAAAVLVAATGAFLVHRNGGHEIQPAPPPHQHAKVAYVNKDGQVTYVGDDGTRQALPGKNIDRVAFSSGGQVAYIAVHHGVDRTLWIADTAGTSGQRRPAPCDGCAPGFGLTWSNDGTRLAYPVLTPRHTPTQLRILTIGNGDEKTITMPAGCEPRGPRFSPDDRSLAFNVACSGGQSVATVDPTAANPSVTTLAGEYNQVQLPTWSNDGQTVYFTATTSGEDTNDLGASIDLYAVGTDGTNLRQITHAAAGERFFAVTPVGRGFLIERTMGNAPSEVGWLTADGSTFTPMKDANGDPVVGDVPQLQP